MSYVLCLNTKLLAYLLEMAYAFGESSHWYENCETDDLYFDFVLPDDDFRNLITYKNQICIFVISTNYIFALLHFLFIR